jgi:hypothetical protein
MYKFREGFRAPQGLSAEQVRAELDRIREKWGILTNTIIVEESRQKDAVLHNCFIWNDKDAAAKFREGQAGALVRSVIFVYESEEAEQERHEYVLTYKDDQRQYMPVVDVRNDPDLLEYSLDRLRSQLRGLQKSVNELLIGDKLPKAKKRKIQEMQRHLDKAGRVQV